MTDGTYRQELDAWARARAATERITKGRGRPPQQEVPDWEEIDGSGGPESGPTTSSLGSAKTPRPVPCTHYADVFDELRAEYGRSCFPSINIGGSSFARHGDFQHIGFTHCPCGTKWDAVVCLTGISVR